MTDETTTPPPVVAPGVAGRALRLLNTLGEAIEKLKDGAGASNVELHYLIAAEHHLDNLEHALQEFARVRTNGPTPDDIEEVRQALGGEEDAKEIDRLTALVGEDALDD